MCILCIVRAFATHYKHTFMCITALRYLCIFLAVVTFSSVRRAIMLVATFLRFQLSAPPVFYCPLLCINSPSQHFIALLLLFHSAPLLHHGDITAQPNNTTI